MPHPAAARGTCPRQEQNRSFLALFRRRQQGTLELEAPEDHLYVWRKVLQGISLLRKTYTPQDGLCCPTGTSEGRLRPSQAFCALTVCSKLIFDYPSPSCLFFFFLSIPSCNSLIMKRWQKIVVWLLFSSIKDDTKIQMSEDVKEVEDSEGKTRKRIEWKYTGEKQIPKRNVGKKGHANVPRVMRLWKSKSMEQRVTTVCWKR